MRAVSVRNDLLLATSAQFLQKAANYVVLVILAKYLDDLSRMGDVFFALAAATVAAILSELGTGKFLTREVAHRPDAALQTLSEVLSIRVPATLVLFVGLNAATALLRPDLVVIMSLTSAYVLAGNLYWSFAAFFVGLRRLGWRFVTNLVGQVLLVGSVLVAVLVDAPLEVVLGCYVGSQAIMLGLAFAVVRLEFGHVPLRWRGEEAGRIVRASFPLFLLAALEEIHFKADTLMLFAMDSAEAVANYEAGYKLLEASRFLVRPAAMVFLPICVALAARGDWHAFAAKFRKLTGAAAALGVGGAAIVVAMANLIVPVVWTTEYASGTVPVLRILFLALPALYLGFVCVFVTIALHLEKQTVKILSIGVFANVALNAMAIPTWGAVGAAWTTLATQSLVAAGLFRMIRVRVGRGSTESEPAEGDAVRERIA